MKQILLIFSLCISSLVAYSTHNRGGFITYEHLGGNTYRATVMTCTYSNAPADRPELTDFSWGDGTGDTLYRDSIVFISHPNPLYDSQKNYYSGTHTYAGPGTYHICMNDPNRNDGILNIANSVSVPFSIATTLVISPFAGGYNNSAQLTDCACPEMACVFQPYCYNVGAYDPDGDSLAYELSNPYINCSEMSNTQYVMPDSPQSGGDPTGGGGSITLDPITGTLCWDSPQVVGIFNFTIRIKEYRNGVFVGDVIQDVQLFVLNDGCNNDAPEIEPLNDTCIIAGDNLNIPVIYSDSDPVTLTANGEPFSANPAAFMSASSNTNPDTSYFIWNTGCTNVQASAYPTYFTAEDPPSQSEPVPLTDIETMYITVNGPPITGLTVQPSGNGFLLNWDPNPCSNITGYKIYRRSGQSTYTEDCCSQDAPELMGYELVGQTNAWGDTTYYDQSSQVIGNEYCYIVTACFGPQVESCVSDQVCAQLQMDVPVITHASVITTSTSTGSNQVCWAMPKELDTLVQYNNHEFMYRVYRTTGNSFSGATINVHESNVSPSLALTDTCFVQNFLNTEDGPYAYYVDLLIMGESSPGSGVYDDTVYVQSSNEASSVYLSTAPGDDEVTLSWQEQVPWSNYLYEVYRETSPGLFSLIGTTTQQTYTDTGLINGNTYCYKVRSVGEYSSPGIVTPLYNWSEEVCEMPIDMEPPCPPELSASGDCDAVENQLNWTNPNNFCADDVMSYNLYYAPTDTSSFEFLMSFNSNLDTSYLDVLDSSIAGCYYVTAIDSVQYSNESDPSNIVCIDNCPYYWVPNVFTPNNDGDNDQLLSFPYKFVESVDATIYNRWGQIVFQTTDPRIRWDGTAMDTGQPVSDGTYYYVIKVNTIRLSGIVQEVVKGHVSVVTGQKFSGN